MIQHTISKMPTITEKVIFLRQPSSYPFRVNSVKVKETHMSYVFLVDGFVFKLKKPVKNSFFDFTQPEARLNNCLNEVNLNRRLATDVYIGVVPLVVNENGQLSLEARGEVVDWLVKMKRLPEEQTLAWQIAHGTVNELQLKDAASMLAAFYYCSTAIRMETGAFVHKIQEGIESTCQELVKPMYNLPANLIGKMRASLLKYSNDHVALYTKRIFDGRVVEGHGDLRPEHIFLVDPPVIIDCLEFNRDLRIGDMVEELSYLAMECEALGNSEVGKTFFEIYTTTVSDDVPRSLIAFYKLEKALLRAYLVIRHIAEPEYENDPAWKTKAARYLQVANIYFREL